MSGTQRCFNIGALMPALVLRGVLVSVLLGVTTQIASAWQPADPGVGLTANLEVSYLEMIIDHHYGALRVTELAAGTDQTRTASITRTEGTSPTPNFAATAPKAKLHDILSLARRNNRVQREEILEAQHFLHDWYGIDYQPQLTEASQSMIQQLEQASAGADFEKLFLRMFSFHHYEALGPTTQCLTGRDQTHSDLHRYCENILMSQIGDIDQMRELLCTEYKICDLQPFTAPAGKSTQDKSGS
jgi:uncharacterized protein (DUF305 family)